MRHKYNCGQITVYGCGIVAACLILVLAVFQIIHMREAENRCYQTVIGAVNSLKGDYQPDLFRRYHILAIDETYYGRGEGYMEERLEDYFRDNLNAGKTMYFYDIADCAVVDKSYLIDQDCADFKQQVEDYMQEKIPIDAAKYLFGEFGSHSSEQGENEYGSSLQAVTGVMAENDPTSGEYKADLDRQLTDQEIVKLGMEEMLTSRSGDTTSVTMRDLIDYNEQHHVLEDPRKSLAPIRSMGILRYVMPDKASSISTDIVNLERVPSKSQSANVWSWTTPHIGDTTSIQALSGMLLSDRGMGEFRQSQVAESELYGIAYIFDSFQGMQNAVYQGDDDSHVLDYEIEYILVGKASDAENAKAVADRLLCIRMVPNMAYALTDEEMKTEAEAVATIICVPTDLEILIEPLTYVFLACWGYAESIMDVKALLRGERVPLVKNQETWQLSIYNIPKLLEQEVPVSGENGDGNEDQDSSMGMSYSEYMAVMLALMPDPDMKYYRMLDIMELNIQETYPAYEIEHCIDTYTIQTQLQENGKCWYLEGTGSYLP